ncbi:hypothetical protein SCHPADRAFT_1001849 [Schizopora paradoxa]|uniref:Uncharacterized protein n=1 Tax=Schizopora paradoxa TaxID=27342 RepID=A0A0H2R741_9AGAM|nr:hypothetical protein SCHPADRAFT_1001849 [Schizopora paradoxa]
MIYLHSAGRKLLAAVTLGTSCVQSRYLIPNGENIGIFKRTSTTSSPSDGSTYTCDGWCWLSFAICFGAILFLAVMTYRACCMSDPEDVQENNNVNSQNPVPVQGGGVAPLASNSENQTVVTQPPAHQEMNSHQDESVFMPSYYDDPSSTQSPAQQYPPAHQGGNPSSPSDVNTTPFKHQEVLAHQGAGNATSPTMASPSNPPTVISKALGHQDVPAVSGSVAAMSPKAPTIITQTPVHQYPPAHQGGSTATSSSPTGTIITQPPAHQSGITGNPVIAPNPPTVISQSPGHQYSPGAHQGGNATIASSPSTIMTPQSSAHQHSPVHQNGNATTMSSPLTVVTQQSSAHQHSPIHQGGSATHSSTGTVSVCPCPICQRAGADGNYKISSAKQGGSATMTSNPYQNFFARQYASRAHQGGSSTIPQTPPTVISQQSPAHQYTSAQQGGSAPIASNPYQGGQESMMPSPSSDIVQSSPYQYKPAHQGGMMPSPVSDIAYSPAHQYPSAHQGGSTTMTTSPHQYPPSHQGGNVTMASNPPAVVTHPPITQAQQHDDYPSLV